MTWVRLSGRRAPAGPTVGMVRPPARGRVDDPLDLEGHEKALVDVSGGSPDDEHGAALSPERLHHQE